MPARLPASLILAVLLLLGIAAQSAHAAVTVRVQLSTQTMLVAVDGTEYATWLVSTARRGYRTPTGTYQPYSLQRMHYSKLYDFTPMPYSIFFHGGYAIHGTFEVRNLGRPVSHGCIRLAPDQAQSLFELIQAQGSQNTTIEISP
ncbi:L,D-transpeptidase [Bradyrhizobium sp. CCBAU 53415]|uniref:L,D-transpeptidase n=1 Tax=Bradyrhizobium sp. CCBAU 53415 TaxID=1325119 RepID=UPI0023068B7A|nr:L,D-transpeptidase [Bradyrhizobium sp. CCBAU 53415]MDA9467790.1 ErfK/YbiS/YcfS/YnhG family protein [Bradyrhizobium sp. CCBAU 53415]